MKLGYTLLAIGVIVIIASGVNMILVLQGSMDPVQFYSPDELSIDLTALMPQIQAPTIPGLDQPLTVTQPENPIDPALMAESFNLLIHIFLLGFLVNVGFKLASIGSQLTRPIVVKVRKSEQIVSPEPKSQPNTPAHV